MWTENQIIDYLKSNLKESRFKHSLGVRDTAVDLAKRYNADIEKARTAGLVHDCAKNMSGEEIIKLCEADGYELDEVSLKSPSLMHGLAGSIIAKKVMGIEDPEILSAVRYHTTGKKNMTLIEKIIYIADYIEPSRDFPYVEVLRETTKKDLDEGLLLAFNNTLKFVMDKGHLIHFDTVEARNYLIYNKKQV